MRGEERKGERKGRKRVRLMREWRVCGGCNQTDSEMNERTLKKKKKKGLKAYRQVAVVKVEISRGSRVYDCSRLNCSKYGAVNASDVTLP